MFRKIIAAVLSAVMAVSCLTAAAGAEEMQTASVMREYGATAVRWNGKSELQAGKTYAITSNVTISKKVVIPSGTTLIVMKNAKLWVSSKGSLYVKGKLSIRSGCTLAVTGTLYQYKGKSIQNYGEIRFSNKANVTLNGKTTVYADGAVTGTPKKLSVGPNADIVCKGENGCKKLDIYIDRTAIETRLDSFFTKAIQKSDMYGAVKTVMNAAYIKAMDEAMTSLGTTFEQFCKAFGEEYTVSLGEENIDPKKVKSIDVKITEIEAELPEEELKTIADTYYNGYDKCFEVEFEVTVKTDTHTYTEETEATVIRQNGKWYMLG